MTNILIWMACVPAWIELEEKDLGEKDRTEGEDQAPLENTHIPEEDTGSVDDSSETDDTGSVGDNPENNPMTPIRMTPEQRNRTVSPPTRCVMAWTTTVTTLWTMLTKI